MNKVVKKLSKIFLWLMSAVGTLFLVSFLGLYLMVYFVAPPKSETTIPEHLPNGFKYIDNPGIYGGKMVTDMDGNIVLREHVDFMKWHENTIYGRRFGLTMRDRYYFICTYGTDCSKTQNYAEEEIEDVVKEQGLPPLF